MQHDIQNKRNRLERLSRQLKYVHLILELTRVLERLPRERKRKQRVSKNDLPYHKRRRRVDWNQWVRELGPEDFYTHHRMNRETFEKLLTIVGDDIERDSRKVRYGSGPVTPRMQLTITLKHLAGDSTHDIKKQMGGTVNVKIEKVDNACVHVMAHMLFARGP